MNREEYFEIERQANKLIAMLHQFDDEDFVDYVVSAVLIKSEIDAERFTKNIEFGDRF